MRRRFVPPQGFAPAPSNLSVVGVSPTAIMLKWDKAVTSDQYTVQYGTSPGVYTGSATCSSPFLYVPSLTNGTRYYVSVYSTKNGARSSPTSEVSASTFIFLDLFSAAAGTQLNTHSPIVGGAWTENSGSWQINPDKVSLSANNSDSAATFTAGVADGLIHVTMESVTDVFRVLFRFGDSTHFWIATKQDSSGSVGNFLSLWYNNGGVYTNYAATTHTWAAGDTIDVAVSGTSIIAYINGTQVMSITNSAGLSATKFGISADTTNPQFADVSFLPANTSTNYVPRYTFPVFTNGSTTQMVLLGSEDSTTWSYLSFCDTSPTDTGDYSMRFIDGLFRMVCSNTRTFPSNATTVGYLTSPNLYQWTVGASIDLSATPAAYHTQGPSIFVDTDKTVHLLFHNITSLAATSSIIYETHQTTPGDWSAWSTPVALTSTNFPAVMIDAVCYLNGSDYELWYKNETTKYIEIATATALLGTYTTIHSGDWAGWGSPLEGPSRIPMSGPPTRAFLEKYAVLGYYYSDTSDGGATWAALAAVGTTLPNAPRGGEVLDLVTWKP